MPIMGGGGGGAAFNGGTITQPMTIDVGSRATAGGLEITGSSGANVDRLVVSFLHSFLELTGDGVFGVSSDDVLDASFTASGGTDSTVHVSGRHGALVCTGDGTDSTVRVDSAGGFIAQAGAAASVLLDLKNSAGTSLVQGRATGFVLMMHSAPADGDLAAGDCALWFDQTNGASKLMVKGKSANGTVVAASIALA